MNTRLQKFIEYKTGGKQVDFAELVGWSPQYLQNLVSGSGSIGMRPVITLLQAFPELNARWLILGEGAMINTGADALKKRLVNILSLEQYLAVMTAEELKEVEDGRVEFDEETIGKWRSLIEKRHNENQH